MFEAIWNFFKRLGEMISDWFNSFFGPGDYIDPDPPQEEPPVEEPIDREPSKFAFIIGINIYNDPDISLGGCVNDVQTMWDLLTEFYGFDPSNIRTVTDERATRQNIIDGMNWLVRNRIPGDELVLHFSGHGSQVVDLDGDELSDGLDEIIIPHDFSWDLPLTDDQIHAIFSQIPEGAYLTFVCDSCHSGTMTRGVTRFDKVGDAEKSNNKEKEGKVLKWLGDGNEKFVCPPIDISLRAANRALSVNSFGQKNKDVESQNHILLAGCGEDEYSSDAFIDGMYQGALTAAFDMAIRNDPYRPMIEIHREIVEILLNSGFDQNPKLVGNSELSSDRIIFGGN